MNKATVCVRRLMSFARLLWAKPRVRVFFLTCATVFVAIFLVLGVSFSHERNQREAEMTQVTPEHPRSLREIRGLMEHMIQNRGQDRAPSAIPQSMWDNSACAAAVIGMVNLLWGENYLQVTDAWKLEQENPGRVRLIYDRERAGDFLIGGEHIVETHNRTWWFSRLRDFRDVGSGESRTSARMYIIGYRYKETRADPKIIEARQVAGADHVRINSHLALLLGRADGQWWAYHFFHDPDAHERSPFRIDAVDSSYMEERFDMATIWEVVGPDLPREGSAIQFVNPARSYTGVEPWLGWANRLGDRASFFFDTAMMGIFGDSRQFPRVERIPETRPSPRVISNSVVASRPARPAATAAACRPSLERQGRTASAHISRRHAPPPRVGARNDRRRREHHAQHAPHARR